AMVYLSRKGNFVVHDGPPHPSPADSENWLVLPGGPVTGQRWVTIGAYVDFKAKTWDLYADGVLIAADINFINPARTSFMGVELRNADGRWAIENLLSAFSTNLVFGGPGHLAAPGDYTGDGATEAGLYAPEYGAWYVWSVLDGSVMAAEIDQFVGMEHRAVPGDYDGDGLLDPGVYLEQTGLWALLLSGSDYASVTGLFGGPGYDPLPAGDYDGDGRIDPGVYHRDSGTWHLLFSGRNYSMAAGRIASGGPVPVPADYDGDGLTDPAVYCRAAGEWRIWLSTTGDMVHCRFGVQYADRRFVPAPGDYSGNGCADLALYDSQAGAWYIAALGGLPLVWGHQHGGTGFLPALP
ncbi:MAG: hypothetical protein ABR497_10550, partial [Kiritimatiellia bacterium]